MVENAMIILRVAIVIVFLFNFQSPQFPKQSLYKQFIWELGIKLSADYGINIKNCSFMYTVCVIEEIVCAGGKLRECVR